MCRNALSVILLIISVGICNAQNPEEQFRDCVNRLAESRGDIATYCVKIDQLVYHPKISRSDGSVLFQLQHSVIEIACDVVHDRTLFLQPRVMNGLNFYASGSSVKLSLGPKFLALTPSGFREDGRLSAFVPDPLSLGCGLIPETIGYYSLSDMVSQLHGMHDYAKRFQVHRQGPIIEFSTNNMRHVFDSARGFLPVEIETRSDRFRINSDGQKELFESSTLGKITPVLVKGIWLPGTVSYTSTAGDSFYHMELDWVAVNEPLPEFLFNRESLESVLIKGGQIEIPIDSEVSSQGVTEIVSRGAKDQRESCFKNLDFDQAPSIQLVSLLKDYNINRSLGVTDQLHKLILEVVDNVKTHSPKVEDIHNQAIDQRLTLFRPLVEAAIQADNRVWSATTEVLNRSQQDQLLGAYLKSNGLRGILNENIAKRFNVTEEQRIKIGTAIDLVREKKRVVYALLASGKLLEDDMPLAELNRRAESDLIKLILTPEQSKDIERILKECTSPIANNYTFGW